VILARFQRALMGKGSPRGAENAHPWLICWHASGVTPTPKSSGLRNKRPRAVSIPSQAGKFASPRGVQKEIKHASRLIVRDATPNENTQADHGHRVGNRTRCECYSAGAYPPVTNTSTNDRASRRILVAATS